MPVTRAELIHEMAAALERADASARVLGARARAARAGAGPAAAFSALASVGPGGLVPPVGTGGALAARHLEHAALAAAAAGPVLPDDVVEALGHAAAEARLQSGGANALDPRGVARAVRREVAAVRGLAAHSMPRDAVWQTMRIGTFLPRAAWMTALLLACVRVAAADPESSGAVWHAAALVAGAHAGEPPVGDEVLPRLLTDETIPVTVAYSVEEVTGALFALSRQGSAAAATLALARATAAHLGSPSTLTALATDAEPLLEGILDAIGALAASAVPVPRGGDTDTGVAV